jgi:cytoplasmic iron level regulating protein YaaA (DUF328/UPF0246 family)
VIVNSNLKSNATAVYFISCVGKKEKQACRARELYISDWFLKARKYVEASGSHWFILSAEYGLVAPDRVIAPYDRTLNTMPIAERRAWAQRVSKQIQAAMPRLSHVVILAGERYREFLANHLTERGVVVSVPMEGLGIGEQLSWLKKHSPPPLK